MPEIKYTAVNKAAEQAVGELINIKNRHIAGVNSAYSGYRQELDNQGVYQKEYFEKRIAEAKRAGIQNVREQLTNTKTEVAAQIKEMCSALYTWIREPADPAFLAQLRTYHDFDLKLEQVEIEAMVEQAAGNFVALRCLNAVAEKAGYHINAPSLPDYMRDLEAIERGFDALYLYAPQNGDGHSTDLLPNRKYHGLDYGRPNETDVVIAGASAKALEGTLREIQERWGAHVQPTITKTEQVAANEVNDIVSAAARKTPDAVTVDQNGTAAEDEARRMGAEQADAARRAAEGLKHYF